MITNGGTSYILKTYVFSYFENMLGVELNLFSSNVDDVRNSVSKTIPSGIVWTSALRYITGADGRPLIDT